MATAPSTLPVLQLLPYQIRWLSDWAQFKIFCKARQIGITFVETLGIVEYLLAAPRQRWYYLSISEDRVEEAIEYAVRHCTFMGATVKPEVSDVLFEDATYRQLSIELPNGSRIIGLPANPRTARGISGHVTLDEYGHQIHDDQIWRAVIAPAVNWGYHLHVISTPNGQQGRYHDVWTSGRQLDTEAIEAALREGVQPIGDRWSRHFVDIYEAKRLGHPVDIDAAKQVAGDELTWLQEYCGKFLDEALAWLPYTLIDSAFDGEATSVLDTTHPAGPLFAGFDVGRKRDLSVLWINELRRGGKFIQKACVTMKQTEFARQQQIVDDHMPKVRRICIDANGIGAQIAEDAVKRYGESRAEAVSLNGQIPGKLAAKVKRAFEMSTIGIADDAEIRRDLHQVRRTYTLAGNVRYEAPRTKDGHADRFWALALALEAGDMGAVSALDIKTIGRSARTAVRMGGF